VRIKALPDSPSAVEPFLYAFSKTKILMKKKITGKGIWEVLRNAFTGFSNDKVTKLSGSLAYYTVFSMGPLLVVIISLCGLFLGREAVEGKIFGVLVGFVGPDTAAQLQGIIKNASLSGKSNIAAIIGVITLLIGATSVFGEIQDSINSIWGLKPKPKRGWLKMLQNRFLSFSVIISLGFIMLVSLGISGVIDAISGRLQAAYPDVAVVIFYIINVLITIVVTTLIFAVIFKVLPDAKIRWKDVSIGAIVTAVLFMIGKFAISVYISKSEVGSTYGAAGSLVVVLTWVYYSSIILYFGAEFTKAYAMKYGEAIHPNHYAVTTQQIEIETDGASVQDKEKKAQKVTAAHGINKV
jgi:membrane protein